MGRQLKKPHYIGNHVLNILASIGAKYNKTYCYPSQGTILKLLQERYKAQCSLRMLNYILRYLEDHDYFVRVRRYRKTKDGIQFLSTLYKFTPKMIGRLKKLFKWVDWLGKGFPHLKYIALKVWQDKPKDPERIIPKEELKIRARKFAQILAEL